MATENGELQLPLFRSLTEQILLAGAPRELIVLNGSLAAIFIISFHFVWILVLNLIIHLGAGYLSKEDDRFFHCLLTYIRQRNYYDT